jgi:hypothetical protein
MVIVRFHEWQEFLNELAQSSPEDRVVRLTLSVRYDAQGAGYLTMVAGYMSRQTIVEFLHYLGLMPQNRNGERAQWIEKLLDERKACLGGLGYTVKSGRYHVAPSHQR